MKIKLNKKYVLFSVCFTFVYFTLGVMTFMLFIFTNMGFRDSDALPITYTQNIPSLIGRKLSDFIWFPVLIIDKILPDSVPYMDWFLLFLSGVCYSIIILCVHNWITQKKNRRYNCTQHRQV